MDKVHMVLVGKNDSNIIEAAHGPLGGVSGANATVIDSCKQFGEKTLYDNHGAAYAESGDVWTCGIDLKD